MFTLLSPLSRSIAAKRRPAIGAVGVKGQGEPGRELAVKG